MNLSDILFVQLWESFSFAGLIWYVLPGVTAGLVIGFIVARVLNARGLLKRGNRWHQWLLKLYFVVLPLCGAGLGFQFAAYYGAHQQLNSRIEAYRPQVEAVSKELLDEFQAYLAALDAASLPPHDQSVEGVLQAAVDHYLNAHTLFTSEKVKAMSWPEQLGVKMLHKFQKDLLSKELVKLLSKKVSEYSGVDQDVVAVALKTPFRDLLSADTMLDLAKKQVATMVSGLYVSVLIQLLALIALIWSEIVLSRFLYRKYSEAQPVAAT
jgi:hypothetical protein